MTNNLKEFLKKANSNDEIFSKLEELKQEQNKDKIIAKTIEIAAQYNIILTPSDFEQCEEEIDDEEMQAVAGGFKRCTCYVGGGGKADEDGKACGCVAYGYGDLREESKTHRCECIAMGTGYDNGHTYGD